MARKKAGASGDAPAFFSNSMQPRWGLCCQFLDSPIKFRQATHRYVATLDESARMQYLSGIVRDNAQALIQAIGRCAELEIGAFRINSQIMPLATHPASGYELSQLNDSNIIVESFQAAGKLARENQIRLSFHPDQFVVLNSVSDKVRASSIEEMNHQAMVAELIDAEALTLHVGGKVGGTQQALDRLEKGIHLLGEPARSRLALENDDRLFSPADLLPFCERTGIPFIYDVHHHRCNPDVMLVADATRRATATWGGREPWMHISSPRGKPDTKDFRPHADYIDPADFPSEWLSMRMTIDVEAKEKERAVLAIQKAIRGRIA